MNFARHIANTTTGGPRELRLHARGPLRAGADCRAEGTGDHASDSLRPWNIRRKRADGFNLVATRPKVAAHDDVSPVPRPQSTHYEFVGDLPRMQAAALLKAPRLAVIVPIGTAAPQRVETCAAAGTCDVQCSRPKSSRVQDSNLRHKLGVISVGFTLRQVFECQIPCRLLGFQATDTAAGVARSKSGICAMRMRPMRLPSCSAATTMSAFVDRN